MYADVIVTMLDTMFRYSVKLYENNRREEVIKSEIAMAAAFSYLTTCIQDDLLKDDEELQESYFNILPSIAALKALAQSISMDSPLLNGDTRQQMLLHAINDLEARLLCDEDPEYNKMLKTECGNWTGGHLAPHAAAKLKCLRNERIEEALKAKTPKPTLPTRPPVKKNPPAKTVPPPPAPTPAPAPAPIPAPTPVVQPPPSSAANVLAQVGKVVEFIEYWDLGRFKPYDATVSETIFEAFRQKHDVVAIGANWDICGLNQLLSGGAYQLNKNSKTKRPIRVLPPYAWKDPVFEEIDVPVIYYEYEETPGEWKPVPLIGNRDISISLQSKPPITRTQISLGHKKTYALIYDHTRKTLQMINEFDPQSTGMRIRNAPNQSPQAQQPAKQADQAAAQQATSSAQQATSSAQQARSSPVSVSAKPASTTGKGHGKGKSHKPPPIPPEILQLIQAAPKGGLPISSLHFEMGGARLSASGTHFLRRALTEHPRQSNIVLPMNLGALSKWELVESGKAFLNGRPLQMTIPQTNRPYGQLTLPEDLEAQEEINMDSLTSKAQPSKDDCAVCVDELSEDIIKINACGHLFHRLCVAEWFAQKQTCPMCNVQVGKITGKQPTHATMQWYIDKGGIAASPIDTYIVVRFYFPDGKDDQGQRYHGRHDIGFLHDNVEGRVLLEMFKVAFRRRVMYGLGISMTNQRYKPTFNVHLKTTRKDKGPAGHGYPDEDYFNRTYDTLEANGVHLCDIYE